MKSEKVILSLTHNIIEREGERERRGRRERGEREERERRERVNRRRKSI